MGTKEEKRKKLLQMLAEADAEVDDLPDPEDPEEEPEEQEEPKPRAAKVAQTAGKAISRQKASEIEGASESTMQAALNEMRQVKALLSGKDPDKAKARSMVDHVFELMGID